MAENLVFLGIVIPAVAAIIVALIKTQRRPAAKHTPPTAIETLQTEVDDLKREIERQHIKIDDITERLAWLEGRDNKK
jgi:hypothetical protein